MLCILIKKKKFLKGFSYGHQDYLLDLKYSKTVKLCNISTI